VRAIHTGVFSARVDSWVSVNEAMKTPKNNAVMRKYSYDCGRKMIETPRTKSAPTLGLRNLVTMSMPGIVR
jgi:hypothetical protein